MKLHKCSMLRIYEGKRCPEIGWTTLRKLFQEYQERRFTHGFLGETNQRRDILLIGRVLPSSCQQNE